jgi:hypothetical protein
MALVLVLSGDLMFGSRVQGSLSAVGNEVELLGDEERLRARLADEEAPWPQVLVADLTDERLDAAAIVGSLKQAGELTALRTLAFYSHVDVAARERAELAGFDMVVPRSRMAREGAQLVARLI